MVFDRRVDKGSTPPALPQFNLNPRRWLPDSRLALQPSAETTREGHTVCKTCNDTRIHQVSSSIVVPCPACSPPPARRTARAADAQGRPTTRRAPPDLSPATLAYALTPDASFEKTDTIPHAFDALPIRQKIVVAASYRPGAFDSEWLVMACWRRWKEVFGLRGYELAHPDANKIRSKLSGSDGTVGLGWMAREGENMLSVTPAGMLMVRKLWDAFKAP